MSEVQDKTNDSLNSHWQKNGTFHLFNISSNLLLMENSVILDPSPLHLKLGIINKIVNSLDLVAHFLVNRNGLQGTESNVFSELLASSLVVIGALRERYYNGSLSGASCSSFDEKDRKIP